jgi:acylpyruvate hydrolase
MRLVSYRTGQGFGRHEAWGVLMGGGVVEHHRIDSMLPPLLHTFIELCSQTPVLMMQIAARVATQTPTPLTQFELLPCLPRPGKIVCLGVNYVDHAKEGGNTVGDYPALFLRCANSLLAAEAPLQVPKISHQLDFEAELAVVIGRTMQQVPESQALHGVFGYACFNDASVRDYQRRTSQWTIGKNFDATGAFGPCIVTADELPPGAAGLHIESRLNGQVMQSANTSEMVFDVARTITLLSACMTLDPGDVIVMGTPAGVGYARNPPVWMKHGDTIEVEIERIGILRNPVTGRKG